MINVGFRCDDLPLSDCERGHVCTEQGTCGSLLKEAGEICRERNPGAVCDQGDFCDGVSPECPQTGADRCLAELPPVVEGSRTIVVRCSTPNNIESGRRPACSAQGFMPPAGARTLTVGAAGESTCDGRRVTAKVSGTLKQASDPAFLERRVKLQLNKFGRTVLRNTRTLELCVRVQIRLGGTVFKTVNRPVTVKK